MSLTHKWCSRGEHMMPHGDFHRNGRRADGLAVWCKACVKAYRREYAQRPEVKKRAAERALARYHLLSADEKLRIQVRRRSMGAHLLKQYGLTLEAYAGMVEAQGGGCAICRRPPREGRRLAVDHDHSCCPGEKSCGACVRGLLCTTCNVWLGFYENDEWTTGAEAYLQRELSRRSVTMTTEEN